MTENQPSHRRRNEIIYALTHYEPFYKRRHPQEAVKWARLNLLDMLAAAPEGRSAFMHLTDMIARTIAADANGTPESQAEAVVNAILDHVLPLPPETTE